MYSDFERLLSDKGMKVADVVKATGVSYSAFSDWKSGRSTPKYERMKKVADFLGVSVSFLLRTSEDSEEGQSVFEQITTLRQTLDTYYGSPEVIEVAQQMKDNSELRMLFDAAKDATPEDLMAARQILLLLKRKGKNAD